MLKKEIIDKKMNMYTYIIYISTLKRQITTAVVDLTLNCYQRK